MKKNVIRLMVVGFAMSLFGAMSISPRAYADLPENDQSNSYREGYMDGYDSGREQGREEADSGSDEGAGGCCGGGSDSSS